MIFGIPFSTVAKACNYSTNYPNSIHKTTAGACGMLELIIAQFCLWPTSDRCKQVIKFKLSKKWYITNINCDNIV